MTQLVFRFIIGGFIVSLFAALGEVLKPKSFAGLFGAAPSMALATLSLTISSQGGHLRCNGGSLDDRRRSEFLSVRVSVRSRLMMRNRLHATWATSSALIVWVICTLGLWAPVLH